MVPGQPELIDFLSNTNSSNKTTFQSRRKTSEGKIGQAEILKKEAHFQTDQKKATDEKGRE